MRLQNLVLIRWIHTTTESSNTGTPVCSNPTKPAAGRKSSSSLAAPPYPTTKPHSPPPPGLDVNDDATISPYRSANFCNSFF